MTRQEKGAERRREVKRRSERRTMATLHIIRCTNWNCSTAQLQVTVNKTSGPPMLLAGSVSGRPHSKWWWCHDIGYPLLAAEHLLCKAPCSGTPCRMTSAHSKTMSPLDSAWKPGFSLATSMLSALETLTIVLYKFTFTIPYRQLLTSYTQSARLRRHRDQLHCLTLSVDEVSK